MFLLEICMTMATFLINVLSLLFQYHCHTNLYFPFYFLFHLLVNLHGDQGNKGVGGVAKGCVNGGGI